MVRIWISRSLVVSCRALPVFLISTFGQDGQGVAAFNNAGHRLQDRENFVLCGFQDDHVNL